MIRRTLLALALALLCGAPAMAAGTFTGLHPADVPLNGVDAVPLDQGSGCPTSTAPCVTSKVSSLYLGQPIQTNCLAIIAPFPYQQCIDTLGSPILYEYIGTTWFPVFTLSPTAGPIFNGGVLTPYLPHVPTNAALMATATSLYPGGVWRDNYGSNAGSGAPPLFFFASPVACPLHSGNGDGGSQVKSSDNKCWVAAQQSVMDFREFGADPTNTNDNSTTYNDFVAAVATSPTRRGFISDGVYRFTQQPGCITTPIQLFGSSMETVVFRRDYDGSGTSGLICLSSGSSGTVISNVEVESTAGHTGGSLMSIVTTDSTAIGNIGLVTIENVVLTTQGSCTNNYSLYVDGSFTTADPKGVRNLNMKNVHVFGAAISSAEFISVVGLTWHGGSQETAGCNSPSSAGVIVGGTTGVPSTTVQIVNEEALDGIALNHVSNVDIQMANLGSHGGISVDNTNTVSYAKVVSAYSAGTTSQNWTFSNAILGGNAQTWAPILIGESTPGTIAYSAGTIGHYSLDPNGQFVTASFDITVTSVSVAPTGLLDIGGFPFAPTQGDNSCSFGFIKVATLDSGYTWLSGLMIGTTAKMQIYEQGSNVSPAAISASASSAAAGTLLVDATAEIHGVCTYWRGN